jgi:hypothetical protein
VVRMRPEAERRLREGFQRRFDEQSSRYAAQLAHARQQAGRFECGEVAGVFSAQAPEGFLLLDGPADARPVLWRQVTGVSPVWTNTYRPGDEDNPRPVVSAYRLRLADGRVQDIVRDFKNVQDPYREMGQLFRGLAPGTVGKTMPKLPTVDEIIATYAQRPVP